MTKSTDPLTRARIILDYFGFGPCEIQLTDKSVVIDDPLHLNMPREWFDDLRYDRICKYIQEVLRES